MSLTYRFSNEYLPAIVAGLAPKEGDKILTIGGSGDQALALISEGARVDITDLNPRQIEYLRQRVGIIKGKNPLLGILDSGSPYSCGKANLDFFKEPSRITRIVKNIQNIVVLKPSSVFDEEIDLFNYNKAYLSNVFDYDLDSVLDPNAVLHDFAVRMHRGALIYVSAFPEEFKADNVLGVNRLRTDAAQKLSKNSVPLVFERK